MRLLVAIVVCCCAVAALGCGGGDGGGTTTGTISEDPRFGTISGGEGQQPPKIEPPDRPPPKQPLVRDLEVGSGPVAHRDDVVEVHYIGVNYATGEQQYRHWPPEAPLEVSLDAPGDGEAWKDGIVGMRVGGRRELIIPSRLLYRTGTVDYVVELAKVTDPTPAEPEESSPQATGPGPGSYARKGPFAAIVVRGGDKGLKIDPPDRPAPKKFFVRDLEKGSGPAAERGDDVAVRYTGARYETGAIAYGGTTKPFQLGFSGLGDAFERAIVGMRVGGRREVVIPSRLREGTGNFDYVIDLLGLEPG